MSYALRPSIYPLMSLNTLHVGLGQTCGLQCHTADDIKSCITLRTLSYGNSGTFLIMGDARFIFEGLDLGSLSVWTLVVCPNCANPLQ